MARSTASNLLSSSAHSAKTPTQDDVNSLPMEIEFAAAWKHFQDNKQPTVDPSEIEELFKVWDKEGKGEIKFEDLAQCLKIFGQLSGDNFTEEEIEHLKIEAGVNEPDSRGMFLYKENFLDLMCDTKSHSDQ